MKRCIRLERAGFLNSKGKLRPEKNWLEEACRDCPLEKIKGYCVYDKAEPISEEDKILLGNTEVIND